MSTMTPIPNLPSRLKEREETGGRRRAGRASSSDYHNRPRRSVFVPSYVGDLYKDLTKFGEDYPWRPCIQCRDVRTDEVVHVKRVPLFEREKEDDDGDNASAADRYGGTLASIRREIAALNRADRHDHVVRLHRHFFSSRFPDGHSDDLTKFLVYDYFPYSLKHHMPHHMMIHGPMEPSLVRSYFRQCLRGLAHLHSRGVVHRDLTPSNLLLSPDGHRMKIGGLERALVLPTAERPRPWVDDDDNNDREGNHWTTLMDSLSYRSPEDLLGFDRIYCGCGGGGSAAASSAYACDVWSAGTILAELATSGTRPLIGAGREERPFPCDSEIDALHRTFYLRGTPDETTWPGVSSARHYHDRFPKWVERPYDGAVVEGLGEWSAHGLRLLDACLMLDPAKRINSALALEHPYLRDDGGDDDDVAEKEIAERFHILGGSKGEGVGGKRRRIGALLLRGRRKQAPFSLS